jgi:hypothetical protein
MEENNEFTKEELVSQLAGIIQLKRKQRIKEIKRPI